MFGFGRKKASREGASQGATARTFVEATGGGWGETPDVMPADGGSHADYVGDILRRAREHAEDNGVGVGEEFTYTITDIPRGISSPHEIIFGLMMRAPEYGLSADFMHDETAHFTRIG